MINSHIVMINSHVVVEFMSLVYQRRERWKALRCQICVLSFRVFRVLKITKRCAHQIYMIFLYVK